MLPELTLLLAHGWGFDASSLRPLAEALAARGVATRSAEDGQLGAASAWPCPEGRFAIAGHSAGFPALLRRFGARCAAAVALNGFTRFAAAPDFPAGVPPRLLSRMATRLRVDPVATVDAFRFTHAAAALPPGIRTDPDRLAAALRHLVDDERPTLTRLRDRSVPVLALCAPDDLLVTPMHARACFRDDEIRWEAGGHLLPLRRPDRCAALVAAFLAAGRS